MKKPDTTQLPSSEEIESELKRLKHKKKYNSTLRSTLYTLITVAAVAILVATLWLPVLQIYGNSMTPTLNNGEIVVTVKTSDFEQGDVVAFYYNNKILVKRVIGKTGDWINIEADGTVYLNGAPLDEPYISEKAFGDTNIKLPYQVPEGRLFVMGDMRSTSIDSRNTAVGCVADEQLVGKIVFKVWPINEIGSVK